MLDASIHLDQQARQRTASAADAALLADRLRAAARRATAALDTDAGPATPPAPAPPAPPEAPAGPLDEVTASALGDVDVAGSRLRVWPTHVELLDPHGQPCGRMDLAAVDRVDVRRRLASTTIAVLGGDGASLVLKGVAHAAATRMRDAIEAHRPAPDPLTTAELAKALRHLRELHDLGLLTDQEVAEKRDRLRARAARPRG